MADRILKRNDTNVLPRALFLDEYGAPIPLTGHTVRYSLLNVKLRTLKVNRASATLADQAIAPGEVYYTLVAGDVDTSGTYQEEWEVTYSSGKKETFPTGEAQIVRIIDDIDAT
jgi:hypothetical protein